MRNLQGFLIAFEAIRLAARGGGFRQPHVRVHFLTVLLCSIFRFPGGGSAKCFKILLKHLMLFICCSSIVVLQLSFCNYCVAIVALQLSCCKCRVAILVLQLLFCNYCFTIVVLPLLFCKSQRPKRRKAQEVLQTKSPRSPYRRKAQEVLTDEKPKKSSQTKSLRSPCHLFESYDFQKT